MGGVEEENMQGWRFLLKIKEKNIKTNIHQSEATYQCINRPQKWESRMRRWVGSAHFRERNRYNSSEIMCAFGLRKGNMLWKKELCYKKYIRRCWEGH